MIINNTKYTYLYVDHVTDWSGNIKEIWVESNYLAFMFDSDDSYCIVLDEIVDDFYYSSPRLSSDYIDISDIELNSDTSELDYLELTQGKRYRDIVEKFIAKYLNYRKSL